QRGGAQPAADRSGRQSGLAGDLLVGHALGRTGLDVLIALFALLHSRKMQLLARGRSCIAWRWVSIVISGEGDLRFRLRDEQTAKGRRHALHVVFNYVAGVAE